MSLLRTILLILVTLLAIAAGIPKVMGVEHEVQFFADAGLPKATMVAFGILQIVGGVLMIIPKARPWAAAFTAIMLFLSAVMIYMSGQLGFACFSLLPVAMAGYVAWSSYRHQHELPASNH